MIKNFNNNPANIIHFACSSINDFPLIKEQIENTVLLTLPEDLTIVTSFTSKNKAILCKQLDNNNINYINAAEGVENFNKGLKPQYYLNALQNVTTDYVLIIDSYDCLIQNFDGIIDKFNSYGKDIIYNAMQYNFPIDDLETCFDNIESPFCKLNSGVLIGKTDKVIEFYTQVLETHKLEPDAFPFELYYVRKTIKDNAIENIGLDYNCDIALCTVCVKFNESENNYIMVPLSLEEHDI